MKTRKQNKPDKSEKPELLIRSATVDFRAAEGEQAAQVRMSVSSEEPVLCYVYFNEQYQRAYEILDHSAGSIDLSRCKDGLVVLDRHFGDQIGLIKTVENKDRKLGGVVEFCTGERAQEISADASKGLRKNISVGYAVDSASYRLEGNKDGIPVVRAMSWTPYEASFEPVPADTTVGVSRAAEMTETKKAETSAQIEVRSYDMNKKDVIEINRLAREAGIEPSVVDAHIEAEKSVDEFRAVVTDHLIKERSKKPAHPPAGEVPPLGGSRQEESQIVKRYNLLNVVRSFQKGVNVDIGFEREVSQECQKISGRSASGIMVPHAVLAKRDLTKLGTSSATVATDLMAGDYIDLLRTQTILGPLGVRFMSGLVGDIAIPKMTGGATGYWVAEGSDITESTPTLGQVAGTPHTCGALVDISRKLLLQSTPSAEMLVRDEILQRIARTVQIAVFQGSGAAGQPSGITNASGINNPTVTQGTPTFAQLLDFPGSIMADNATADGQKWAMTGEVWAKLAATATNGAGSPLALDYASRTLIGFPYFVSEDVGANSLFFGDWASVMVGIWGNGVDLNVDTSTLSAQGALRLIGLQDVDVMVRNGEALAYNTAVTS